MTAYKQIKEIATGMYAKKVCGGNSLISSVVANLSYKGDFSFEWVKHCDTPNGSDIQQHRAAWDLFWRALAREWKQYHGDDRRR